MVELHCILYNVADATQGHTLIHSNYGIQTTAFPKNDAAQTISCHAVCFVAYLLSAAKNVLFGLLPLTASDIGAFK